MCMCYMASWISLPIRAPALIAAMLLQELCEQRGSADSINLHVFRALEHTIEYSPGNFISLDTDCNTAANGKVRYAVQ